MASVYDFDLARRKLVRAVDGAARDMFAAERQAAAASLVEGFVTSAKASGVEVKGPNKPDPDTSELEWILVVGNSDSWCCYTARKSRWAAPHPTGRSSLWNWTSMRASAFYWPRTTIRKPPPPHPARPQRSPTHLPPCW